MEPAGERSVHWRCRLPTGQWQAVVQGSEQHRRSTVDQHFLDTTINPPTWGNRHVRGPKLT